MLRTGLEFAPGTTDDCKRLIGKMYSPEAIMNAYRTAKSSSGNGDIVLVGTSQSPDIHGGSRLEYAKHLQQVFGKRASEFAMWHRSAQSVMKLPIESEAMWLVVDAGGDVPTMCVIYATPYKVETN